MNIITLNKTYIFTLTLTICQHSFCTTNFNFNFFPLKVEFNFSVQHF